MRVKWIRCVQRSESFQIIPYTYMTLAVLLWKYIKCEALVTLSPVKKGQKSTFFDGMLADETLQIWLAGFKSMQQRKLNEYHQKNICCTAWRRMCALYRVREWLLAGERPLPGVASARALVVSVLKMLSGRRGMLACGWKKTRDPLDGTFKSYTKISQSPKKLDIASLMAYML